MSSHAHTETDTRMDSIEIKTKKPDGELARYKEQMAKLRDGPRKVRVVVVSYNADKQQVSDNHDPHVQNSPSPHTRLRT